MNRRVFLQMATVPPFAVGNHPMRSLRAQFTLGETVSIQMIVTAHARTSAAELWRKGWEFRVFEGEGEWYLQTSKRLMLPDHLAEMPGSLMYHTFVIGYAAAERSMLVGTFRRENVACVIRILGDHQAEMIDLADWFSTRQLPGPLELIWSGAQLQGFVPTSEEFGREIELNDGFWP